MSLMSRHRSRGSKPEANFVFGQTHAPIFNHQKAGRSVKINLEKKHITLPNLSMKGNQKIPATWPESLLYSLPFKGLGSTLA